MKNTTKKTKPQKINVKKSASQAINESNVKEISTYTSTKKIPSFYIGLGIVVFLLLVLLYNFKGLFVVALVNNQPITRFQVVHDLEQQAGKQILSSIVTKTLIEQEANKRGIKINENTLNAEVKKIEDKLKAQGQNFDQLLTMQGMTRQSFVDQLKIQKIIEAMFSKDTTVTDKEVTTYKEQNAETLAQNPSLKDSDIKLQLQQNKLRDTFQKWLTNAQKQAKITYFLKY